MNVLKSAELGVRELRERLFAGLLRLLYRRGDRASRGLQRAFPHLHLVGGTVGGFDFIAHVSDRAIGATLRDGRTFEKTHFDVAIDWLRRRGRPGRVFVDVGANIGTHTIYAMRSGLFDRYVSFEPVPLNYRLLTANLALNDLLGSGRAFRLALADSEGSMLMGLDPRNFGSHRIALSNETIEGESVRVPVRRLDDCLREAGHGAQDVGILWMDAEGFERQVLTGAPRLLAAGTPAVLEFGWQILEPRQAFPPLRDLLGQSYRRFLNLHRGSEHAIDELTACYERRELIDVLFFS